MLFTLCFQKENNLFIVYIKLQAKIVWVWPNHFISEAKVEVYIGGVASHMCGSGHKVEPASKVALKHAMYKIVKYYKIKSLTEIKDMFVEYCICMFGPRTKEAMDGIELQFVVA